MFKQASNRYHRSKGFKVKHAFQIALLVAVSVWLLYQVKHSHDKRRAYEEKLTGTHLESTAERKDEWNANGLGRKGKLEAFDEGSTSTNVSAEKNEEEEEEEIKDSHTSSEGNEHQDQGAGDDEIDRHEEEGIAVQESQEENENITEKTENDEVGKAADAEEEEHSNDVGEKFVQIIKQETDDFEETAGTKDDHSENKEEPSEIQDEKHDQEEHEIAKEQSENEHRESEEDEIALKQRENKHHEVEEDKKGEEQKENAEKQDENAEKQNENELREGDEIKNPEKENDSEHHGEEEVKDAEKKSENEHHEGEEVKDAEKKSENEHHEGEEVKDAEIKNENEHHEGEEVKDAEIRNENEHHEGEVKNAEIKNENEHHEGEEVKNAEIKNENEHHEGEEDKFTENVEIFLTESQLLKENETVAASSPKGHDREKKTVDSVKMEESGAANNESFVADGVKGVAFADSNAQKEANKLGENQEASINSTVSYSDSNAETEHERLEENRKAAKETEVEEHEMEQSFAGNLENVAENRKELDEFATSESNNETENTSETKLEDVKLDASLDQRTVEDVAKSNDAEGFEISERSEQEHNSVSDEASFKTEYASDENLTLASSERNATIESEHPDGGDASSHDIPRENEGGDRTDLETLPESETIGQNSEEISAQ